MNQRKIAAIVKIAQASDLTVKKALLNLTLSRFPKVDPRVVARKVAAMSGRRARTSLIQKVVSR